MVFDADLADRVRRLVAKRGRVVEKRMFGGLSFMTGGKMFCGVLGDELVVRVGPRGYAEALEERHVRPMDFTGRPLTGYIYVGAEALGSPAALGRWVERGLDFVRGPSLPGGQGRMKRKTTKAKEPPPKPPADFAAALAKAKKARAAWKALPPSHRRAWIEFVEEAKREETRARRIDKAVREILGDARTSRRI